MIQFFQQKWQETLYQESLPSRCERVRIAAMYGVLLATTYILAGAIVNVYTFPNLPLGMDWGYVLTSLLGLGGALSIAGAIAGWLTEEYEGISIGGAIMTGLLAIIFLVQLGAQDSALTLQSLVMAIPLIGVNMLAAAALRWMARKHLNTSNNEVGSLRLKKLAQHIALIALIGAFVGAIGRMDLPAEQILTKFDSLLQDAANDPQVWAQLPVKQIPPLAERFGQGYTFYVHRSELVLGSLNLTVQFDDGFRINCQIPVGGANFFTDCRAIE